MALKKEGNPALPEPTGVGTETWPTNTGPTSTDSTSKSTGNGQSGQPPEVTFRVGRVSASIFINSVQQKGSNGDYTRRFRTVTIQRSYKAEDGSTKYVTSFGLGEVRNAIRVLELAAEHLESRESRVAD